MTDQLNGHERATVALLRIVGVSALLAIPAIAMPFAWMDAVHRWLGMGSLPDAPIVRYLARNLSAFYAVVGALLLHISLDVRRYRSLGLLWSAIVIALGIAQTAISLQAGMPAWWTWLEGPPTSLAGLLMFWLCRHIQREAA